METSINSIIYAATKALHNAYAPYSKFDVGAAILTSDNQIFTGCNIENSSYGLTVCAERIALFKAVSEGYHDIQSLALVTKTKEPIPPCGACRQVLAEFNPEMTIIMATTSGKQETIQLNELFPKPFDPAYLT